MTHYEKSAIIGYYRMGATYQEIGWLMGIAAPYVKRIVEEYLQKQLK